MSRSGRGVVEHDAASRIRGAVKNIPEGVSKAVEKLKEVNEESEVKKDTNIHPGLRSLVLLGRMSEDVVFGEYTFKISTLTSKQQKDILKRFFLLTNEEKVANIKIQTLSEAISTVNDMPLESLYYGEEELDSQGKKMAVILELQSNVIDKLFERFEELNKKSGSMFQNGGLEDSVKN
jgi:hypothetical protein